MIRESSAIALYEDFDEHERRKYEELRRKGLSFVKAVYRVYKERVHNGGEL